MPVALPVSDVTKGKENPVIGNNMAKSGGAIVLDEMSQLCKDKYNLDVKNI